MKFKTTWVFLFVFLALVVYLVFVENPGEKKEQEKKEKSDRIFDFVTDQVDEVEIFSSKGHFLIQKNSGGKWQIHNPLPQTGIPKNITADSREIEEIVQRIHDLKFIRTVEEKAENLKTFGFMTPEKNVVLKLKNNTQVELLIGEEGALSQSLYIKRGDSGTVYLTDAGIKTAVEKDLWALRDKHLLTFDRNLADQIEVKTPKTAWTLTKKGAAWSLSNRPNETTDEAKVSSLLFQIESLEGEKVLNEEKKDLKAYGLDKPVASVILHEKGKIYGLVLGEKKGKAGRNEESLSALGDPSGPVFQVKKDILNRIPMKEELVKKEPPAKAESQKSPPR